MAQFQRDVDGRPDNVTPRCRRRDARSELLGPVAAAAAAAAAAALTSLAASRVFAL